MKVYGDTNCLKMEMGIALLLPKTRKVSWKFKIYELFCFCCRKQTLIKQGDLNIFFDGRRMGVKKSFLTVLFTEVTSLEKAWYVL